MSACYQAQMARSSNYLLSRFVFDHLWGIPGDTEDHQVKSLGMNICNIASTGSGCCRAISLWLFVTRVYGANGHQQRLCLFVGINKHAFASRWNFYKSFALNKLEVKPRLLLFPIRRDLGLSPTWRNILHCTWFLDCFMNSSSTLLSKVQRELFWGTPWEHSDRLLS